MESNENNTLNIEVLKTDEQRDDDSGSEGDLNHEELMEITSGTLNDILKKDQILSDLPRDVTLEEVISQIAVQHGQSITVYAVRADGEEIPAVVNQKDARVVDLKRAIQRHVTLRLKRSVKDGCYGFKRKKISWNYIWKTNFLCFDGERLRDDKAFLSDFGIVNKSKVTFIKKLRDKGAAAAEV